MESQLNFSVESSETDSKIFFRSFSEYSSEDVNVFECTQIIHNPNPLQNQIDNVMRHRAQFNTSYAASSQFAEALNNVPGAQLKIPTSKDALKREAKLQYQYKHYVFCESCGILVEIDKECETCNIRTKKTKDNYFIYIPIEQQIKHMLDQYISEICDYLTQTRDVNEISDVIDSDIYKSIKSKYPSQMILPFTLNIDGAKIFNSSSSTLWPIQLTQSYLPPNLRFHMKNVVLVGLYCGKSKPDVPTIMLPLATEMNMLQNDGISVYHNGSLLNFRPTITFSSCDIPARADVQNLKSSGYYSCPRCEQIGTQVMNPKIKKSYVRFLAQNSPAPMRTHDDHMNISIGIIENRYRVETKGIKGISCMIAFPNFDLVKGFNIDWMHGTVIGVFKLLMDIWLGNKRLVYTAEEQYRFKGMTAAQRILLNRRIISLKPPTRFQHKPRSILDRSFFTANEYRSLLWFYMKFSLRGLLSTPIITHFELLSNATYILSKARIQKNEIIEAAAMLKKFADQFQYFYGKNAVTINVHLLHHYADVVTNSGPLWCHSLFTFESNIGVLKKSFHCTTDVVEQIAYNYCLKKSFQLKIEPPNEDISMQILRLKLKELPKNFESILTTSEFHKLPNQKYHIGYELKFKRQVFKSCASIITKSVDYFVEMCDGTMGMIEFFFMVEGINYLILKQYEVIIIDGHFKKVKPTKNEQGGEEHKVFKCTDILRKLIYLKFTYSMISTAEIVTMEPNHYEGT